MMHAWSEILAHNPARAYSMLGACACVLVLMLWVSYLDLRYQSVTFWKMLVASGSMVLATLAATFTCKCSTLASMRGYLLLSLPIWCVLLWLNIRFNHDRFMGKADADLLSCAFSMGVTHSMWLHARAEDPAVFMVRITGFWYTFLGLILAGSLVYIAGLFIWTIWRMRKNGMGAIRELKGMHMSILPMFIPLAVGLPFAILSA